MIKSINVEDFKKLAAQKEVLLVDVREPGEHKSECIEGASCIPLANISVKNLPTTQGPIVIHCHSGRRSLEACKKLLSEDPNLELYSLEGGLSAWKKAGHKIIKSGGKTIPIDRQTQIVAGSLVLIATIMSVLISNWFLILTGFVGAGLILAGITGWCGTAKLLAGMPWNRS